MARQAVVVDAPNFFFVDQSHFLSLIGESFKGANVYFVVDERNQNYKEVKEKLLGIWKKFNAKVYYSKNVDLDVVERAIRKDVEEVAVASNDAEVLRSVAKGEDFQTSFIRVFYRQKNGKWVKPPKVFEELKRSGFKVIDLYVLNRIEASLASILGIDFTTAVRILEHRKEFERSVVLAQERVVPKLGEDANFQDFERLCDGEGIYFHKLEVLYLLALKGALTIKRDRWQVFVKPAGKKSPL